MRAGAVGLAVAVALLGGAARSTRGAERRGEAVVWAASDGQGRVELLWSPIAGWPAGGFRLERVCGSGASVVADRISPLIDAGAVAALGAAEDRALIERLGADLGPGGAAGRRAAAEAFVRSAVSPKVGYALGLRAVDTDVPGECRYRLSGLDAKGQPGWRVETEPLDPRRVTPGPLSPGDLAGEVADGQVRLRWTPPAGDGLPTLTFAVSRRVGEETRALTPAPQVPLRSANDPHAGFVDVDPPRGAEAVYSLTLFDILGRPSPTAEVAVRVPDTDALLPPEGVAAADEPGRVVVTWTPRTSPGTAGYVFERSTLEHGPFSPLPGRPLSRETSRAVDEDVVDGTTYYYRVRSRTKGGEIGDPSGVTWALARAAGPPPAPRGLTAETGRTRVRLAWSPVPGPVSGYLVERQTAAGPWARRNAEYSAEPRFDDHLGPQDGAVLRYRVSVVSHRGQRGAPGEVVTVKLPDTVPPPVPRIERLKLEPAGVVVAFRPGAPAASTAALRVLRSESRDEPGLVLGPPLPGSARSFTDAAARPGRTYFYRVLAADEAGNRSAPSPPLRIDVRRPTVPAAPVPQVAVVERPFLHVQVRCPDPPSGLSVVVERRRAGEPAFVVLGTLAGGTREFLDPQPSSDEAVSYRLVYRDDAGARGEPSAAVAAPALRGK